jgi:hypothetical protein
MKAYDIKLLQQPADRSSNDCHGWCFGLPPGITPEQWPLDPGNGYPLMHGFTLLLPAEYRVFGAEIIALSFFATAPDHNDGGSVEVDEIACLFSAQAPMPVEPRLLPFWQAAQRNDARLFYMEDILGCKYAVRLLTQSEFDGPYCLPPDVCGTHGEEHPFIDQLEPPRWMTKGSARAYWDFEYSPSLNMPPEEYAVFRVLAQIPDADLKFNRALTWTARAVDPNAGVAPREYDDESGYQMHYYWLDDKIETANYREHDWAKDHGAYHIGGTMRPIQAMPEFSPYYVEFDEAMGGYNFGGGNAQLDFKDMKFDWACG